jgi:UDP-N-acetylmuramoylalanine--D-glutamate ligase
MAKVLRNAGAKVTIVDQKSPDSRSLFKPLDELSGSDIEVITSWTGTLDGLDVDIVAASPGVPNKHPALHQAQDRGIPILSEIEVAYRIAKSPIVGITGTNGKSTVTALTYHLLINAGRKAILCGNIAGSGFGETTITSAAESGDGNTILVAEVSSFQLEWVDRFRPRAATITNITQDHLDHYESFEAYANTKHRIYYNSGVGDLIVANEEFPETMPRAPIDARLSVIGKDAVIEGRAVRFEDDLVDQDSLWVPARHSLINLAHAVLLCGEFGLTPSDVLPHVHTFPGLENRLELVGERDGVRFVNNSMCTNPAAVLYSLDGVRGRPLLLMGGVSKVEDLSAFEEVGRRVPRAFLYGRDAEVIRTKVAKGGASTTVHTTVDDAFNEAMNVARSGDTIVLSPGCASFDQFEDFIDRGNHFRRLAKKWIEG